jgi:hypothetical protein
VLRRKNTGDEGKKLIKKKRYAEMGKNGKK